MTERFKAWFTERSLREKRMLIVMAALAALTLIWGVIIRPVSDGLSSARERHSDAVVRLAQTEVRAKAVQTLQREHAPPLGAPLDAVIRDRANEAGFALASLTPEGQGRVQIAIGSARPGALFGWIAKLEESGVLVDSLNTSDNGDKTISAQITLKAQGI